MNNQIWIMTSAFDQLDLEEVIAKAQLIGVQGLDLCVFRKDGTRDDFVATHLDYDNFDRGTASRLIDQFNTAQLRLSIGAFDNLIGGDESQRLHNQNHLLKLIRLAYLLGGDENDVTVGTFVGYNHELGIQEHGFEKNLEEYQRIFTPIIKYAEDLGVTVLYENCPMEGWRSSGYSTTFNNLTGVLAARKIMYELIPSKAHGEIYDPSHDIWQQTDPVEVIRHTDMSRLKRIHVKSTRNISDPYWGNMYPMQKVKEEWAESAGIPYSKNDWDRHHYEATLPGFGLGDSMDWRSFVDVLKSRGFNGPFEIENEAKLSKQTGNLGAIIQGCKATVQNLAPLLWTLGEDGYQFPVSAMKPLIQVNRKEISVVTMKDLS
ncbi:sugar phosphate isomerase/epimerase family protein [Belliella kenyensis]|uniref:Sugar phosphate isomerase/epimerase family protein n=1 Tax=Belliella kenyensis TaxID=1472724 RepID=A0ABV8EQU3_9BACT|nr:sugar phosphate isomerase/epimerase [Belliella kenyensis]MCH7402851.1 sugar phosphate isomerase/epimerase [Belliella kenyensis]MDN3602557.1 sugar phosphate isomerase/epimerase [Belliella kenyensis]